MQQRPILLGAALVCLLLSSSWARATIIGACDDDLPGACTKSVDINAAGTQLTIVLMNTSPPANGGFITADAFSLPGSLGATLFSSTNTAFSLISGAIKVAPFSPDREFLLTTDVSPNANNSFEGGGSPNSGIGSGAAVTFLINITGGTLTDNLANETSIFSSQLIRFRGFDDNDSDKDSVVINGNGTTFEIPETSSFLLLGAGLLAIGFRGRKKHRKK